MERTTETVLLGHPQLKLISSYPLSWRILAAFAKYSALFPPNWATIGCSHVSKLHINSIYENKLNNIISISRKQNCLGYVHFCIKSTLLCNLPHHIPLKSICKQIYMDVRICNVQHGSEWDSIIIHFHDQQKSEKPKREKMTKQTKPQKS